MHKTLIQALGLTTLLATGAAQAVDGQALARAQGIPQPAVIAHRGASFDAPESTTPAYQLARELGADYLEMDLQRTRDGVLVVVHDDVLLRTSDVAERFPERKNSPVSAFTLAELKSLDAGSWFNKAYPERAREHFKQQRILTLDEVIDIAEADPKRHPGLYIETKEPAQFPGIEQDLKKRLEARGWLDKPGKVVLQTFDRNSLKLLHEAMPQVPKILLLWVAKGSVEPASGQDFAESGEQDKSAFYARQQPKDRAEFERWLGYAKEGGAIGTGPSAVRTHLGEQSYSDLIQPWMNQATHERGMLVHVYTLDEKVDFEKAMKAGVDGIFTNRAGELMRFYGRSVGKEDQLLGTLGY
ncbi:glycerophosphodiester phosphodiesterase [Pseudomonas entomophila]|uniref:Glycerophosphodiester phosphodiesterase n=2 Tax=Pseudomonas entomophila TaxID=312306 RepID=Q1I5R9_PSEE4|nr:glycerophosphodiester phosphodiesterase family protein [Pseudomonas entomophila]QVM90383.1 glycerophosphodiester phosphodiesterase [Pseudomonas entomophila]WMW07257.1 glycerophosphodiester phosphodiesterase family protein [Pseudomonas entomophila]CAK17016.1 Glycerophosphodiester phosphodiesterase [Pseudomonas entomophila L48]